MAEARANLALVARVVLPFAFGFLLSDACRVVNAVVAPVLEVELGLGPAGQGLVTSAFFLAFAAMQLPAGGLLDRFGPRRVNAALLVVAAGGAGLFAVAEGPWGLALGRALLGAGMAVALMAGFQAFALWFGPERAPRLNSVLWAFGALGSLAATAPLQAVVDAIGWRAAFTVLAVLILAAAAVLGLAAPEPPRPPRADGARPSFRPVFAHPLFRAFAPVTMATQAVFLSLPGLWAAPWLADVAGLDAAARAATLAAVPIGMLGGFVALSFLVGRFGITARAAADVGTGLFLLVQAAMIAGGAHAPFAACLAFGAFGVASTLYYPELARALPLALAGRANTGLNLVVFVAAFTVQYGMAALVGLWPAPTGARPAEAYAVTLGLALALQAAAFAWLLVCRRQVGSST